MRKTIVTTPTQATPKPNLPQNYAEIKTLPKRPAKKRAGKNWRAYEAEQARRFDLEVFISEDLLEPGSWLSQERSGRRGRPRKYSDAAILAPLQIGALFRLSLRGSEHLTRSLLRLAGIKGVSVPDHVTLSRARQTIDVPLVRDGVAEPRVVILDGTGLRVSAAGEWNARKWGNDVAPVDDGEAGWVKLSVCVDYASGRILSFTLQPSSGDGTGELSQVPALLDALPSATRASVREVIGDGLYDTADAYSEAERIGARLVTPPRVNAAYGLCGERDVALKTVAWHGAAEWRRRVDYNRRSLVEATIGRLKALTGERLASASLGAQRAEVAVRIAALNAVTNPAAQTRSSA